MYSYIKGKLMHISTDHIIIENSGIGYAITVPFTSESVYNEGDEILIHTHFSANENGVTLFGFYTKEEREMFLKLTTVSGIGPKGAISILSTLPLRDIIFAIINEDDKLIAKAPGIGAKTAKRLIVDLKDKLDISEDTLLTVPDVSDNLQSETAAASDAIAALSALGYSSNDARRAVLTVDNIESMDVEEILSRALKNI